MLFRLLALVCLAGLGLAAQVVPGRYIVELAAAPAIASKDRARVAAAQRDVRAAVERQGAVVVETVGTVANALIVETDDAGAAGIASVPGVRRVHRVFTLHAVLDAAVPLHKAPEAWAKIGGSDKAGAGVKIGILDTGIDIDHPGFKDTTMQAPDGFPKASRQADLPLTSGKIIAARSYEGLLRRGAADTGFRDRNGHGTAVAMAAAGVPHTGILGRLSGMAPKAWLGIYRITRGETGSSSSDVLLKAFDDAVADGMDVINLSFAADVAPAPADDVQVAAVERAVAAGVIVVVAAGNNGPDPNTIASPATAPSAITAGGSLNARAFGAPVTLDDNTTYLAVPGSGPAPGKALSGPLVEVPALGCDPLPASSLSGAIALVLRGDCYFEVKLNNAAAAGALAAVVRTDEARPDAITMNAGQATLPAVMVSWADGEAIRVKVASRSVQATVGFKYEAVPIDAYRVSQVSSNGPDTDDTSIKPDLLAAAEHIYTATQATDADGELYEPDGYTIVTGTSFSSPIVAGAAALLKSARPGLTPLQYRSLLTGSAAPLPNPRVQSTGAGLLNVLAALDNTIAVVPSSVGFGSGGPEVNAVRTLTLHNLSSTADTLALSVQPVEGQPAPSLSGSIFAAAPGAAVKFEAAFTAQELPPGEYQGFITVRSANSGAENRVPYWYAVKSGRPARITLLSADDTGAAGATLTDALLFRVTETSGINAGGITPEVTVVSGGGKVVGVNDYSWEVPGCWGVTVRLGPAPGDNVFRIVAGEVKKDVTITAE